MDDAQLVLAHPGALRRVRAALARPAAPADALTIAVAAAQPGPTGTSRGVTVIPVRGILIPQFGLVDPFWGLTGYDGLMFKLARAAADPAVSGILFDVNSPGGFAHSSLEELADAIAAVRKDKPVWALCSDHSYSAAYWIASQAERVFVPVGGGVGSVGAYWMHADFSRAMDAEGVTITIVKAGEHKVDGNPYEPLPDDVRVAAQESLNAARSRFAAAVARGRNLALDAVLATEARCLTAAQAIAAGFADEIKAPAEVLAAFAEHLSGASAPLSGAAAAALPAQETKGMTTTPTPAADQTAASAAPDPAAIAAEARRQAQAHAAEVTELCALAGQPAKAAQFIAAGTELAAVRKALIDAKAEEAEAASIAGAHGPGNAAGNHGWDAVVAKVNAAALPARK